MEYQSLNKKLKTQFGCKVYKLALSATDTCPNRDGTVGVGGCIFCKDGSGAFAEDCSLSVTSQIERAKLRVAAKNKDGRYIAYFQSYTNTYGDTARLEKIFTEAINHPDIVLLSIATRPDCLEPDKLGMLSRLAKIKPLWVELGLQTVHKTSVDYIRRGYENEVYERAVKELHKIGAEVITHLILHLPGESVSDMKQSVRYAVDNKTDGIKLSLLHVLRGTDLEKDYNAGLFTLPTLDEYADTVIACLEQIPSDVTVHRITGDGDKRSLVAPLWSADKKLVMDTLNKRIEAK